MVNHPSANFLPPLSPQLTRAELCRLRQLSARLTPAKGFAAEKKTRDLNIARGCGDAPLIACINHRVYTHDRT